MPEQKRIVIMVVLVLAALSMLAADVSAYTQLQVLLPGEHAAPGTASGKTGSPTGQTVGIPFAVRVRACDASWNTVTTVTNIIKLSSTDASASLPGETNLVSGVADLIVTLNAAGSFTFSATDNSDPTIPEAVSASVAALAVQGFEFARINQKNQYAGQPMPIELRAVDAGGQQVSGFSGTVRLQEITSFGEGRISPETVTLSNGSWSGNVTLYRADETAINRGNVNIYAFMEADLSRNGTSDPFTVHPGTYSRVQIIVPGQSPLPGSQTGWAGSPATQSAGTSFAVDVYATDAYWNPVPSVDVVRVTSTDPSGSTPVSGALTDGHRQFSVTLNTVGDRTLSVTNQTNGSIQGMTSPSISVIPSGPDHFVIDPIGNSTAGDVVSVTIRAVDVGGNTIPGYVGQAILAANTGPGSISPESITFTDGVWTGDMTFRGAGGAVSFTCSDFASPPHFGSSNNFQVQPGPYSKLQVLLPGQTPQGGTAAGFVGSPDDQQAGSDFSLIIRAVDEFWNRVTGINSVVDLSSSDLFAGMPREVTLSNGELVLTARLYRSGTQSISAADRDDPTIVPHTSEQVNVVPGIYARLLLIAPGESVAPGTDEGRTGAATDQSINYSFTVVVYATDRWFNPVTEATDVIRLSSGDPLAELPSETPLVNGRAELTLRLSTGGFQQISVLNVSQPAMPISTTQVRAISSGFHLEAEVSPTTVQAGEVFDLTVKVTNDAGAVIQEMNSAVTVEIQNASTGEPGQGLLESTQFQLLQGQVTVPETYTFAEDIILIVSDDVGNIPAVTEVITVNPGDPFKVALASDPPWVRGNKHATISAAVLDEFDNGVPGEPVVFSLLSGLGSLTQIDSLTDDNGTATADFFSPRQPEIGRVRATSGALSAEMNIETALVDPNELPGHVTNYPNPFHPNEAPTTIAYKLADNATVLLRIYTLNGGLVYQTEYSAGGPGGIVGLNEVQWDGRNGNGDVVASGGYILVVEAQGNGETIHVMRRKIAVVR